MFGLCAVSKYYSDGFGCVAGVVVCDFGDGLVDVVWEVGCGCKFCNGCPTVSKDVVRVFFMVVSCGVDVVDVVVDFCPCVFVSVMEW